MNITKTTKTILFACLITAMILPFSAMDTAEAIKDPLKKKIKDAKIKYKSELKVVEKENKKNKKDKDLVDHEAKIKRVLYRLDLVDAITDLPNWDNPSLMTTADLEKRDSLAQSLHQSGEEEAKFKKTVTINTMAPVISASHPSGTWDIAYDTLSNGNVNCIGVPSSTTAYQGTSEGYVNVWTGGSYWKNVWDYDAVLYKNSTQGCANPPNDHYSNTLKVVDLFGDAPDCYVATSSATGTTNKYCSGFDAGTIALPYTRGTYDNNTFLESSSWGLGAILWL